MVYRNNDEINYMTTIVLPHQRGQTVCRDARVSTTCSPLLDANRRELIEAHCK